jgi:outer membrane autotransporter protein
VETSGVTVGIDLRPNEYTAIGLFEQYTNSDADLVGDGRVDREGMKFGIYGTVHNEAGFYLNGLIAAGVSDYQTRRAALGGFANGNTDGWDYDGMIGGGYTARTGGWTYGPLASLTYSRQQIDEFTETGSMLPLVIDDQYGHSLTSRIGFEVSYEFQVGEIFMVPRLSVAWEHEFLQDYQVDSRLAAAAQNGFTTSGATIGRDSVDIRAGLDVQWNDRFSTHVSYQCELARSNYSVHSFSLGLHLQF